MELVPSEWTGNYTCADDNNNVMFVMNITRSDTIDTVGSVIVAGRNFSVRGAFATSFKLLTLQNDNVIPDTLFGRNFTDVELNGKLQSPVYIDGFLIFTTDSGDVSCPVELRRSAGTRLWHYIQSSQCVLLSLQSFGQCKTILDFIPLCTFITFMLSL